MAAAKSANPVTLSQVMAAGIFVSGCVLIIGGLQLAELFGWLVPPPVIRGVQLGVGLNVAVKVGSCNLLVGEPAVNTLIATALQLSFDSKEMNRARLVCLLLWRLCHVVVDLLSRLIPV